jgi:hypothetical protein
MRQRRRTPSPALQPEKPINPIAVKQTPAMLLIRATPPAAANAQSEPETARRE